MRAARSATQTSTHTLARWSGTQTSMYVNNDARRRRPSTRQMTQIGIYVQRFFPIFGARTSILHFTQSCTILQPDSSDVCSVAAAGKRAFLQPLRGRRKSHFQRVVHRKYPQRFFLRSCPFCPLAILRNSVDIHYVGATQRRTKPADQDTNEQQRDAQRSKKLTSSPIPCSRESGSRGAHSEGT